MTPNVLENAIAYVRDRYHQTVRVVRMNGHERDDLFTHYYHLDIGPQPPFFVIALGALVVLDIAVPNGHFTLGAIPGIMEGVGLHSLRGLLDPPDAAAAESGRPLVLEFLIEGDRCREVTSGGQSPWAGVASIDLGVLQAGVDASGTWHQSPAASEAVAQALGQAAPRPNLSAVMARETFTTVPLRDTPRVGYRWPQVEVTQTTEESWLQTQIARLQLQTIQSSQAPVSGQEDMSELYFGQLVPNPNPPRKTRFERLVEGLRDD